MGKKQHSKDKLYITTKEWTHEWGGKKGERKKEKFKRLPFNYCAISLLPFEHPYCTKEGIVFDLQNVLPFLKQFKKSPVTGEPMQSKDLIKLNFSKNSSDEYHCPIMFKTFNENSRIVAIKSTGNVFSYEAVDELNLKPKNFKDLLTSEPFVRKDIITLQDPSQLEKFNISNFYHIKNDLRVINEDEEAAMKDPMFRIRKANLETESTLKELEKTYKDPTESYLKSSEGASGSGSKDSGDYLAHYSTGAVTSSFTSTSQDRSNTQQAATLADDVVRYDRLKKLGKKGYVRVVTTKGNLNLELHCNMVFKTCDNFIKLCEKKYYNNTVFHRLIKHFMVQGGDPTGTGHGGESIFGAPFEDEFKPNLSHSQQGILSMANSGKNTNGSQFFITFRSCQHLDNKHTVFGRVVGGLDTLKLMESVETDDDNRPLDEIRILSTDVFTNPFEEVDEEIAKERAAKREAEVEERQLQKTGHVAKVEVKKKKVYRSGAVGKYIPTNISKRMSEDSNEQTTSSSASQSKKKKVVGKGFGDFSGW